jgi:hypothetical protein
MGMETNWAAEQLQTIRTLMERSAVYRRALAPIMLLAGALGTAAAVVGILFQCNSFPAFIALWFTTAALAVTGALLIARRQALKEKEAFWSPPTRRVVQALAPPLLVGLFWGLLFVFWDASFALASMVSLAWVLLYGFALHAAGFFMPRGIRLFGWIFIVCACLLIYSDVTQGIDLEDKANWLMGFFFGVLHLAYGAYLYLTEKGKNAA